MSTEFEVVKDQIKNHEGLTVDDLARYTMRICELCDALTRAAITNNGAIQGQQEQILLLRNAVMSNSSGLQNLVMQIMKGPKP
jgi:hypothetical protein